MNWVRAKDVYEKLGVTLGTLHTYAHTDKKKNITNRFMTIEGKLYVNNDAAQLIKSPKVTNETQLEFERLYFILRESHKTQTDFHRKIAKELDVITQNVASYFVSTFHAGREETKLKYIKAMQIVIEKEK
jgi:hypothetical protein